MNYYPKPLGKLVSELSKLPGIGSKSAQRIAFDLLDWSREDVMELAKSLVNAKDKIHYCKKCYHIAEEELCEICQDSGRDPSVICVVEDPRDLIAMERSGSYHGLYHVLHGTISPMDGRGPDEIRLKELLERLKTEEVKEVILATGSDMEGETTALYIARLLKPILKVSRIAAGIPVGGDLEYADEITLMRAMEGRQEL